MFRNIFIAVLFLLTIGASIGSAQDKTDPASAAPEKKVAVRPRTSDTASAVITVEAEICTAIEERQPTGTAVSFPADIGKVYLWSKVLGAQDSTTVNHVWYYKDEQMATVELPVKSSSWRTWSSKSILPHWIGSWEVKILDTDGTELKSIPFQIVAPNPEPE